MRPNDLVVQHANVPSIVAEDWRRRAPGLDVDDLTGDLNLALVRAAHSFDPDKGDFRPYAFQRVRGAALDHMRERDHVTRSDRQAIKRGDAEDAGVLARPVSLDLCMEAGLDVEEPGDFTSHIERTVDTLPRLRAALDALPDRHRETVVARFWHEEPIADIADRFGVHPSRVSQLTAEAVRRMRKAMDDVAAR